MIRSSIIVVLIVWYCFGVFRIRAMASDGLPDGERAGPSCAPSGPLPGTFLGPALDIWSESLYELVPDIPDVMGLRALRPDTAAVKVMSALNTVQPTGRRRQAGGRSAVKRIPDGTVLRRDNQRGIPRKRALFVSDGPDSTTSGSDILEGHYDRPPEEGYSDIPNSGRPHDVHVAEELCSPSRQLEKAVVRLQQDIADYHAELKLNRTQTPAVSTQPPKRSGFTSTSVPSGKSNWEQYRQVFEAIVRSNGWVNVTAALQLLSHLDGDAINVALLVPESQRVLPGFLVKSLSDHYSSPGRLAEYKCQFQRASG